jgi:RNA polymerase sigma-70 factor, ECF subfamily
MDPMAAAAEERKLQRLEEALWVTQAQAGDSDAFLQLMNRFEKPLLYYLRRLVPEGDAALDLHQEVWIDAFRGLSSLQLPEAFRVWLYRIAHHKAARFIRKALRHEVFIKEISPGDPSPSPHDNSNGYIDAETLHHALAMIPPEHRELLVLHYLREFSTHELAAVLDCPPGTIKSRLHHARLALKRILERNKYD